MSDAFRPLILKLDSLAIDDREVLVYAQQFIDLFDAGLDPNCTDRDGLTPLMRVVDIRQGGRAVQSQLVQALIARGANPLINDMPIGHTDNNIVGVVIGQEISRSEHLGKPMRAADGGNAFHTLAKVDLGLLYAILCENYNQREETNFPRGWLDEKRPADGATPLHVMWGEDGLLASIVNKHNSISVEADVAWECVKLMDERGGDLWARDYQGRRPIELMNEMIQKGFEVSEGAQQFWGQMSSILNKTQLEERTQIVNKPIKRRRV
jgi:hypothetical protein